MSLLFYFLTIFVHAGVSVSAYLGMNLLRGQYTCAVGVTTPKWSRVEVGKYLEIQQKAYDS